MIKFTSVASRQELFGQVLWFLGWLSMTAVGLYLHPSSNGHGTHTQLGLPPCGSVFLFHRPCPGCGLTTSVTATLHGQLGLAFKANPFGAPFYLLYTASAIAAAVGWLKKQKMDASSRATNITLLSLLAVYVIYGVIRFVQVTDYMPF